MKLFFWRKPQCEPTVLALLTGMLCQAAEINNTLGVLMAAQDDINTAVQVVTSLLADLQTQTSSLVADLTAIQAQIAAGQPVDTTALDAAVNSAAGVQQALDAAVANINTQAAPPAPPAP